MQQSLSIDTWRKAALSGSKWLLAAGVLSTAASHVSFSVGLVAWIANLPFLLFLARTQGWKSRLLFFTALIAAWSAAITKIITPPIPFGLIFMYSVPIALIHLPAYLLWAKFRTQRGAFLLFPAVITLMEWLQYTFTPFASWGVTAYTQADNLALMQSLALFGMPGLSFLVHWINVSWAENLLRRQTSAPTFQIPLGVLSLLWVCGALRVAHFNANGHDTIALAAVGTNSEISRLPLATPAENQKFAAALFSRTRTAARAGAKVVVWNEAALVILPENEAVLKDSLAKIAAADKVAIFAAYVVAVEQSPLKYENKYVYFDPQGNLAYDYEKHQPVPGEPAIKGTAPLQVTNLENSSIGGAICYDYDFPYIAKDFGKLKADIVALPSSDWRGIDPIHTQMAAFRAVEQGHSVLRSTRFGLSAGINPCGEMVSKMSSFDKNEKIMWANLPRKSVRTFYAWAGDWVIWLCLVFGGWFFIRKR